MITILVVELVMSEIKYRKFIIKKLVRDKSPELLLDESIKYSIETISSKTKFLIYLKFKLIEESIEILKAKKFENIKEEIVDLLEVLDTLIKEQNIQISKFKFNETQLNIKTKKISKEERRQFLLNKKRELVQLSHEILKVKKFPDSLEKIGNLWYAINFLIKTYNLSMSELINIREIKNEERGSFNKKLFLKSILIPEDSHLCDKYVKAKYKEIISSDSDNNEEEL